jgi:hypothetical protein
MFLKIKLGIKKENFNFLPLQKHFVTCNLYPSSNEFLCAAIKEEIWDI